VILEDPPRNLDPRFTTDATSMRVSRLVFSSLVSVDNDKLEVRPELARDWTVDAADPRIWTLNLRRGVRWHDGREFSAQDVVYTYQSVMDPALGSPFREPYQANIAQVEAVDRYTVRFHLIATYATFLTDLVLGIVPKHLCASNNHRFPSDAFVGTGPYRFVRRIGERRLDLEAFVDAFDGPPRTQHLVFRTIKDEGTRLLALLGGSGDLLQNGVSPVLSSVLAEHPDLEVSTAPSISFSYLALNLRDPLLADHRVRQALALAIPREKIIETHLKGNATLATGMLAPFHWAYEPNATRYDYDPGRARALLHEAGLDGHPNTLSLTIKISTHRFRRTVARAIAQAWREIGVDAKVRSYEFGTFFSDIKKGHFQVYFLDLPEPIEPDMYRWMLHGLGTPVKAPSPGSSRFARMDRRFLSPGSLSPAVQADSECAQWQWLALRDGTRNWIMRAFGEEPPYSTANRMFYANPHVDCRVDLGRKRVGRSARKPLYQAVQAMVARDLPFIALWHPHVHVVTRKSVAGFKALPNMRFAGIREVTLVQ
jgi:peptide/nickel transport system substrate-binding protein